jgi:hypothetical protein
MVHIFVNHSEDDDVYARKIFSHLRLIYEADSISSIDYSFRTRTIFHEKKEIGKAGLFIFILSEESLASERCSNAYMEALEQQKPILGVQVRRVEVLPQGFDNIPILDIRDYDLDEPEWINELHAKIYEILGNIGLLRELTAFISYKRYDTKDVSKISELLKSAYGESNIWYDTHLHIGERWWQRILSQIKHSDIFIYLISKEALESPYCSAEFEEALRLQKPILPIIVRNVDLPSNLSSIQMIDMTRTISSKDLAKLHGGIVSILTQDDTTEVNPLSPTVTPMPSGDNEDTDIYKHQIDLLYKSNLVSHMGISDSASDGTIGVYDTPSEIPNPPEETTEEPQGSVPKSTSNSIPYLKQRNFQTVLELIGIVLLLGLIAAFASYVTLNPKASSTPSTPSLSPVGTKTSSNQNLTTAPIAEVPTSISTESVPTSTLLSPTQRPLTQPSDTVIATSAPTSSFTLTAGPLLPDIPTASSTPTDMATATSMPVITWTPLPPCIRVLANLNWNIGDRFSTTRAVLLYSNPNTNSGIPTMNLEQNATVYISSAKMPSWFKGNYCVNDYNNAVWIYVIGENNGKEGWIRKTDLNR